MVGIFMAAVSLFKGLMDGKAAANAEARNAAAKNKAILKFNEQVLQQAATEVSQTNMQRAEAIRATNAALFNIRSQATAAKDESVNYAASNDNIGASTKAAASSVEMQSDRGRADAMMQLDHANEAFNMQLRNISLSVERSMKDQYISNYKDIGNQAAIGAIGSAVNAWASYGGKIGGGDTNPITDVASQKGVAPVPKVTDKDMITKINKGRYFADNRGRYPFP